MIARIREIKGIGLLHDVHAPAHALKRVALVYGENGRGKSTLTSILASCSTGDGVLVEERTTIDGSCGPTAEIHFSDGHQVRYAKGVWSESRPEILVFDGAFVQRNVHSGAEVTADNRKNLLDFALGVDAVAARRAEDAATQARMEAAAAKRDAERQIDAYANGMALRAFRNLDSVADLEAVIASTEARRDIARREKQIRSQPVPELATVPTLDIDQLFSVLNRTLDDVHVQASAGVAAHFARFDDAAVAKWIGEGQSFDNRETCPYCGQATTGVELVEMYRSHFNAAYQLLQRDITASVALVESATSERLIDDLVRSRKLANERLTAWRDLAGTGPIEDERDDVARLALANVRTALHELLGRKALAVGDAVGLPGDRVEIDGYWRQLTQIFEDHNDTVSQKRQAIERYVDDLAAEDAGALEQRVDSLYRVRTRHSAPVVALFDELGVAEVALERAEAAKSEARDELKAIMSTTLSKYRDAINGHLADLGARFKITEIKTNFHGQAPRTDYGIELRGRDVALAGGRPSFATALSEGDKRTMAFAFFAASVEADSELSRKVVVVDDPMSSLDRTRRDYTKAFLVELAKQAGQLIVLAHDAYFLKDLESKVKRDITGCEVSGVKLERVAGDYTDFGKLDLAEECESTYARNYRVVEAFENGTSQDHVAAGTALRPLLEGYLHRRYPGKLPDVMLGSVLARIEESGDDDPLRHAKPEVGNLRKLNDFAGQFHHDTNPDYSIATVPDAAAVASYARRVLAVVHGETLTAA